MSGRFKRLALLGAIVPAVPAMAQVAHGPIPMERPILWIDAKDYPPAAIRADRSGRVLIELGVDASGRIRDCRIKESSGAPILDATTCRLVQERGRFDPAIDGQGRQVASTFSLPVKWVIPGHVATQAGDVAIDYIRPGTCTVLAGGMSRHLKPPVCSALIQGIMATHPAELPERVPFSATEDMLD